MIESCTRRRMIIGISLLGLLTVLVLIVESHWTEHAGRSRKQVFIVEQNSTCFQKEPYKVIKECEPCTDFEIKSKTTGVCIHTHFKEVLKCANGETVTRSCDKAAYLDERSFWQFEGFVFFTACISTLCAIFRKRVLNRRMLQRVARQLANSV